MRPSVLKSKKAAAASPLSRQASETSPASTIPTGPAALKNVVLNPAGAEVETMGDLFLDVLHTGERVTFGTNHEFEYVDKVASFVGRGSYGLVYKGLQRTTAKSVAIKVVPTLQGD